MRRFSETDIQSVLITPREAGSIAFDFAQGNNVRGLPMGLPALDKAISGGIKPGDLVSIGARPGSGKSFLLWHVLHHNAQLGNAGLLVSAEMPATQLGARGLSRSTGIDSKRIIEGNLEENDWHKITKAAVEREQLPLYLLAHRGLAEKKRMRRPKFTIDLLDATLTYLHKNGVEIKIVAIDYAQRIKSDTGQTNRKDVVDEVSGGAKDIALKWAVPVLLASQLGRQVDTRTPPLPLETDFKESGNLEEDADILVTLFYPLKYYKVGQMIPRTSPPRAAEPNQLYIQLHKQRMGASNLGWWFYFDPKTGTLGDLADV